MADLEQIQNNKDSENTDSENWRNKKNEFSEEEVEELEKLMNGMETFLINCDTFTGVGSFLSGYSFGRSNPTSDIILRQFGKWLNDKFNIQKNYTWHKHIRTLFEDERDRCIEQPRPKGSGIPALHWH